MVEIARGRAGSTQLHANEDRPMEIQWWKRPTPKQPSPVQLGGWVEPGTGVGFESDLSPRNNATEWIKNLKAEFERIFRGRKLTLKILKF